MNNLDVKTLISVLKSNVPVDRHLRIDELYHQYSQAPENEQLGGFVYQQLVEICGTQLVEHALRQAAAAMLPSMDDDEEEEIEEEEDQDIEDDDQDLEECEDEDDFDEEEGDEENGYDDGSNAISENGNIEVCEASHAAWNHCVQCFDVNCSFPLCQKIRPYVEHRKELNKEGIRKMCKESCVFCLFHDNLQRRVIPHELTPREQRNLAKTKRLIQTYSGLLLAHKQSGGDPVIRQLYDHMMTCMDEHCRFRVSVGSCRSSRELMYHVKTCKSTQTKRCGICCELPPKVKNMKKRPRSLPLPALVQAKIQEQRKEKAKKQRRERNALKRAKEGKTAPSPLQYLNFPNGVPGLQSQTPTTTTAYQNGFAVPEISPGKRKLDQTHQPMDMEMFQHHNHHQEGGHLQPLQQPPYHIHYEASKKMRTQVHDFATLGQ